MSVRWHKYDALFHLRSGRVVKLNAFSVSTRRDNNGDLIAYNLQWPWRHGRRDTVYLRLDTIDAIETRRRGWWRWVW